MSDVAEVRRELNEIFRTALREGNPPRRPTSAAGRQPAAGFARLRLRFMQGIMRLLEPSAFETAVLQWIAAESRDEALDAQLAGVSVAEREYTVVGCYSRLIVAEGAPLSAAAYSQRGPLSGPCFESKVVEHGGGTLLWFKAGRADCLEIHAYGDYFPSDHAELGDFRLFSEGVST